MVPPTLTVDGGVAAHAATRPDGERGAQLVLGDADLVALGKDGRRRAAEDPRVRRGLVEVPEPGAEQALDLGERGDRADVRESLLAHPAPEALHLRARGRRRAWRAAA